MSSKDKWFGIKRIKKKYQPKPYTRKDIRGDIVPLSKQAEAAAEYLEQIQWGATETNPQAQPTTRHTEEYHGEHKRKTLATGRYRNGRITKQELKFAIANLKKGKASGPDELTSEMIQAIESEENLEILDDILDILNEWWENEDTPEELTKATIASIYKKGNTELQENYIPIYILNTLYKLFAKIIKERIEEGIEEQMQKKHNMVSEKEEARHKQITL